MAEEIKKLEQKLKELNKKLSQPDITKNPEKYEKLSKKHSEVKTELDVKKKVKNIEEQIEENQNLKKESDADLQELAEQEIKSLKQKKKNLLQSLKEEKGKKQKTKSAVIEIRSGAGGEEAALFAADLFKIYTRYAEKRGWKTKILSQQKTSLGGYKEIEFEIEGKKAFETFKNESGVHRVQRIPETEKSGRIHTSTVTVAVLPQLEQPEKIKLDPSNLRVDTYRASGKGGQHVNTRETAVRITHKPTNTVASCQDERSQHKNKDKAEEILKSKLLHLKQQQGKKKIEELRADQVGQAERAEKIRTYNFPQNRITDHRIEKSWHNLEKVLDGDMDKIVKALQKANLDQ